MNGRLRIHLKANERIFINGGALRVDRKVAIELLNDVVFLLEPHLMSKEQATTPLRQLYFALQAVMLEPQGAAHPRRVFDQLYCRLRESTEDGRMRDTLDEIEQLVERHKAYEALKRIKALFDLEPTGEHLERL